MCSKSFLECVADQYYTLDIVNLTSRLQKTAYHGADLIIAARRLRWFSAEREGGTKYEGTRLPRFQSSKPTATLDLDIPAWPGNVCARMPFTLVARR